MHATRKVVESCLRNVSRYCSSLSQNSAVKNGIITRLRPAEANYMLRVQLAAAYRGLDAYGLNEGVCNHLTTLAPAADGSGEVMLVIPYGLHWSEVTPSNLIAVNSENEIVEGTDPPELTASCIHRGVYRARPDVRCVMHTHMPYATALACLKDPELKIVHQNTCMFLNRVAYDHHFGGTGVTLEEGSRIASALGDKDVLFLGNHGALTVAKSLSIALTLMYYLERCSMFQVLAMSTGKELRELPEDVAKLTSNQTWDIMDCYADKFLQSIIRRLHIE